MLCVLKRKTENKPQWIHNYLISVEVEKHNLRVSKSQSDIMEDHKPSIPKIFVTVISDDTSLKPIKILRDIGAPID